MAIFWPESIQNIAVLLMTSQFNSFGYTKQTQIHIKNEAWLNIFKISYQTVGGIPVCDHPGGSNSTILPKTTQNIGVLLITITFTPLNDTKQLHYGIYIKALLYFFKINPQTIGSSSLYDHHKGSNGHILTRKHQKYNHFVNNSSIWTYWLYKTTTKSY